jgi:hypothetical protein
VLTATTLLAALSRAQPEGKLAEQNLEKQTAHLP